MAALAGWFGYRFWRRLPVEAEEPYLAIISPKEGDYLTAGDAVSLRWVASGLSGPVHIFYHIANEDNPFWIDTGVSPDVGQMEAEFTVPYKSGQDMSIFLGVWDWGSSRWLAETTVDNLHIV